MRALDVAQVVTDVDRGVVLEEGVALARAEQPAFDRVDLEADGLQAELRKRGALCGDHDDSAAGRAYCLDGGMGTRHRGRAGDAGGRVRLAVGGSRVVDLPGREPASQLALDGRPQPG